MGLTIHSNGKISLGGIPVETSSNLVFSGNKITIPSNRLKNERIGLSWSTTFNSTVSGLSYSGGGAVKASWVANNIEMTPGSMYDVTYTIQQGINYQGNSYDSTKTKYLSATLIVQDENTLTFQYSIYYPATSFQKPNGGIVGGLEGGVTAGTITAAFEAGGTCTYFILDSTANSVYLDGKLVLTGNITIGEV